MMVSEDGWGQIPVPVQLYTSNQVSLKKMVRGLADTIQCWQIEAAIWSVNIATQEQVNKAVLNFVIGAVMPLSIVEV